MSAAWTCDAAIIGGGSFGSALAAILAGRGLALPDSLRATVDCAEAVRSSRVVLVVMPSKAFRATARLVGEHLQGDQIVVHATKGLEIETFRRMSEILREETCALKIGVLSGPNLAPELNAGHPAGALVASRYDEVVEAIQGLFAGAHLRVYGGRDVVGTEIAGSFKNIIAIAAGISDGLGLGDNTRSLLVTRGLGEMARLGVSLGADVFTFGGLAGIGDLVATCSSKISRNHQVGERLAKGETLTHIGETLRHVAEGVPTTEAVFRHLTAVGLDLPIVRAVHAMLYEHQAPVEAVRQLMSLPVGSELAALRYR